MSRVTKHGSTFAMGAWLASLACAMTITGCSTDITSGCKRQCELLVDCGIYASMDVDRCVETCDDMSDGYCVSGCYFTGVGDTPEPEKDCMRALLSVTRRHDGDQCTNAYYDDWCEVLETGVACDSVGISDAECF